MATAPLTLSLRLDATNLRKITDHSRYEKALESGRRRAHGRIGAFIRTRARSLIGNRAAPTTAPRPAGAPPRARRGARGDIKRIIFIADQHGVTIGPVGFKSGETTPDKVEFGGTANLSTVEDAGRTRVVRFMSPADRRRTRFQPRTRRAIKIDEHPFMGPALDAEIANPKLMDAWENIMGPIPN